jgi:hypothetical protein
MSPLCIGSLPDFLFLLWVVFTCVFFCLVLLMDGFPCLIFIYRIFLKIKIKIFIFIFIFSTLLTPIVFLHNSSM